MYFRMLKSEIKQNKGLNLILFIFIMLASLVVFIGGGLMYSNITLRQRTAEICDPSDAFMIMEFPDRDKSKNETSVNKAKEIIDSQDNISGVSYSKLLELSKENISAKAFENALTNEHTYYEYFLSQPFEKYDILYDESDRPIELNKGEVAVPMELKRNYGFKKGDKISITAEDGSVFEFTVKCFYKDPFFSPYDVELLIVTPEDFQTAMSSFLYDKLFVRIKYEDNSLRYISDRSEELTTVLDKTDGVYVHGYALNGTNDIGEDAILRFLISVFMTVIVSFLILIIFMITRFTMISDLKNEEREIGTIKAIGSDTVGFRWLFSAKYTAFAAVGTICAMIFGVPVFYRVSALFNMNSLAPEKGDVFFSGLIAVLLLLAVIVFFAFLMMRRINRISVVDALQGENHGERFKKSSMLYLYKCKKMPISLFWVLSDLLKRFKRYLFLIVAYTLGASIMLIAFNLRNTVISREFLRYLNIDRADFWIEFSDETIKQIKEYAGDDKRLLITLNKLLEENNIPAKMNFSAQTKGVLKVDGIETNYIVYYDLKDPQEIVLREGVMPKLENEIVLSYYAAHEMGLRVGDIVDFSVLEFKDKDDEGTYVDKKMVITGFKDCMESGGFLAILGENYKGGYLKWSSVTSTVIFDEDHGKVIKQIKELFPDSDILDGDELVRLELREFDIIFEHIEYILGGSVLFLCAIMTFLFVSVFITDERAEIAQMKSMGFSSHELKWMQVLRIALITVISLVLALIIFKTAGVMLLRVLFSTLMLSGFTFLPEYLFTMLVIPVMLLTVIILTVISRLGSIDKISIGDITEE